MNEWDYIPAVGGDELVILNGDGQHEDGDDDPVAFAERMEQGFSDGGDAKAKPAEHVIEQPGEWTINDLSSADFDVAEYATDYLVNDVIVKGEPFVIGGFLKTLKTSVGLDLGLSMALQRKFLGRFWSQPATVGIISGESGKAVLQETAKRICASKGVKLSAANLYWHFQVPPITNASARAAIVKWVERRKLDVLIIDPLYLAFCGVDVARNASNVFAMGTVYRDFAEVARESGVTIGLVHHTSRTANRSKGFEPATLEDLSFAGLSEFAASWLMLSRRSEYIAGTGHHELWLTTGGRAGHGGLVGLDVDEGVRTDPGGRRWEIELVEHAEARAAMAANKGHKQADKDRGDQTALLNALETPASQSELCKRTSWTSRKLNRIAGQIPRFVEVTDGESNGQKCKLYRKTIHAN